MEAFAAAMQLLPAALRQRAAALEAAQRRRCEEFRLRLGRPPAANLSGEEYVLAGPAVTEEDILFVLEKASRASFHSVSAQLCRGYVNAPGGLRLGLCGTAVMEGERLVGLRDFSSLALRIPREHRGCGDGVFAPLTEGGFRSALLYSPPGLGKTTLLRDLVRRLSESGLRVCVADERGEIAGAAGTAFAFDPGPRTDVMTGVPKARAAELLLRSMNPQVLAMDEVGSGEEARALFSALGCGVRLLATAHAGSFRELLARPAMRELLEAGAFERFVGISAAGGQRMYEVKEACDCWERCC